MNIIWITIFAAFCILVGFIYIFKKRKDSVKEFEAKRVKRKYEYLPYKRNVTIYTVECKLCNNSDELCDIECTPTGTIEFTDIEVKWNTEEERAKMLDESNYLMCEKHKIKKVIHRQRTYQNI